MKRNGSHPHRANVFGDLSSYSPRRRRGRGHRTRAEILKARQKNQRERRAIAKRIVRDRKLRTMAEAMTFAQDWIECAMSYADTADFYKNQAEKAFARGIATERRKHR